MKQKQKGFTLIELIVVMAIIAILVLIAAPKFIGYTEKAKLTQVINDIKVSEKAAEQYYLQHDLWPRDQLDTAYTDEQLTLWVDDFRNLSGKTVTLEDGDYYDIDWELIKPFMAKPDNDFKYIIQNPVGDIYYVNDLTPAGEQTKFAGDNQVTTEPEPTTEANLAPTAFISLTPETNINTSTNIVWSYSSSTDPDGDLITNAEWEGNLSVYSTAGNYTIRLRVQDSKGLWSEWVEKTISVTTYVPIDISSRISSISFEGTFGSGWSASSQISKLIDGSISGDDFFVNQSGSIQLGLSSPSNITSIRFYDAFRWPNSGSHIKTFKIESWNGTAWVKVPIISFDENVVAFNTDEATMTGTAQYNRVTFKISPITTSKIRVNVTSTVDARHTGFDGLVLYGN